MIARMWRGRTSVADCDRYVEYLKRTGCSDLLATPGNRGVLVFRRTDAKVAEFLLVSLWDSHDAIRQFAGPDLEAARYYPEDARFLLELEPHVTHFDLVVVGDQSVTAGPDGAEASSLQLRL